MLTSASWNVASCERQLVMSTNEGRDAMDYGDSPKFKIRLLPDQLVELPDCQSLHARRRTEEGKHDVLCQDDLRCDIAKHDAFPVAPRAVMSAQNLARRGGWDCGSANGLSCRGGDILVHGFGVGGSGSGSRLPQDLVDCVEQRGWYNGGHSGELMNRIGRWQSESSL